MLPSPTTPRRLAVLVVAAVLLAVTSNAYHYYDDAWAPAPAPDAGYGYAGISNEVLKKDQVPCSQRGASYYVNNCRPGAHANPYVRGCSAITQCRG